MNFRTFLIGTLVIEVFTVLISRNFKGVSRAFLFTYWIYIYTRSNTDGFFDSVDREPKEEEEERNKIGFNLGEDN